MGETQHVQILVDLVVPAGVDPQVRVAEVVDLLNDHLHRHGMQESVWVVCLPEDR